MSKESLELWLGGDEYNFFVDGNLGVIVGRLEQSSIDGTCDIEVNDEWIRDIPDLEAAKRLFVDKYDFERMAAQCGPGTGGGGDECQEGFTIVKL